MERRFRLQRGGASRFLWPMVRGDVFAVVDDDAVRVRLGILGAATVPVRTIRSLSTLHWPWWGGFGVRFARRMVAFTTGSGTLALITLTEPLSVRTPLPWRTQRVAISVEDVEGFLVEVSRVSGVSIERSI